MTLSTLAILLGLGFALPSLYALLSPAGFTDHARKFPRCEWSGYALMAIGTSWFLYNFNRETLQEFLAYKNLLLLGFATLAIAACIFVRDFLAVRGLSICLLLLGWFTLNATRWAESPWRLVLVTWAYLWIVCSMWWTVSPWRLRDYIQWLTASPARLRLISALKAAFGLVVMLLGLTVLKA
jgi:hypothetical protein